MQSIAPDGSHCTNSVQGTHAVQAAGAVAPFLITWDDRSRQWCDRYRGQRPLLACVLGFTATGLIPGISAAGATPDDRRITALADAEFLINGPVRSPRFPLPPLQAGASPVLITRAVTTGLDLPVWLFDAGLAQALSVPAIALAGEPARCLTTGQALSRATVDRLLAAGLAWGDRLAAELDPASYGLVAECVVGGTSTALALLLGLGIDAADKVNSSHPTCNHSQKWQIVQAGLARSGLGQWQGDRFVLGRGPSNSTQPDSEAILNLVAAIGDPMQPVAAGLTIALSRSRGVLLGGGTQMLAVYALARAIAAAQGLAWEPERVAIGTTGWVARDRTGNTEGLLNALAETGDRPAFIAAGLDFGRSRFASLRAYEAGFVKEGVGAGASAIAAHLLSDWSSDQILGAIEALADRMQALATPSPERPLG